MPQLWTIFSNKLPKPKEIQTNQVDILFFNYTSSKTQYKLTSSKRTEQGLFSKETIKQLFDNTLNLNYIIKYEEQNLRSRTSALCFNNPSQTNNYLVCIPQELNYCIDQEQIMSYNVIKDKQNNFQIRLTLKCETFEINEEAGKAAYNINNRIYQELLKTSFKNLEELQKVFANWEQPAKQVFETEGMNVWEKYGNKSIKIQNLQMLLQSLNLVALQQKEHNLLENLQLNLQIPRIKTKQKEVYVQQEVSVKTKPKVPLLNTKIIKDQKLNESVTKEEETVCSTAGRSTKEPDKETKLNKQKTKKLGEQQFMSSRLKNTKNKEKQSSKKVMSKVNEKQIKNKDQVVEGKVKSLVKDKRNKEEDQKEKQQKAEVIIEKRKIKEGKERVNKKRNFVEIEGKTTNDTNEYNSKEEISIDDSQNQSVYQNLLVERNEKNQIKKKQNDDFIKIEDQSETLNTQNDVF